RRTRYDLRVRREAPGDLAGGFPLRGARCLAQWVLRVAEAGPERPLAARGGSGAKIRSSFAESDRTYGARRVWHDLLAAGIECGLHAIERLMRRSGLRARP